MRVAAAAALLTGKHVFAGFRPRTAPTDVPLPLPPPFKQGATINVLGAGLTMLGLSATIGVLLAKTLTSATVNPFLATSSTNWNPVLAFDVFNVQVRAGFGVQCTALQVPTQRDRAAGAEQKCGARFCQGGQPERNAGTFAALLPGGADVHALAARSRCQWPLGQAALVPHGLPLPVLDRCRPPPMRCSRTSSAWCPACTCCAPSQTAPAQRT